MPYKKYTKKRFNKNRAKFAKRFRPRTMVSTIKKVMRGMAEKKYYDFAANYNVSTLGSIFNFSLGTTITQGDTQFQRIGTSINLKNLNIRGIVDSLVSLPTWSSATVRMVVFQWLLPPPAIISNVVYNWGIVASTINSQYRKETAGQYKILYDKRYLLSSEGPVIKQFNININRKMLKRIQFTNPSSPDVVNKGELYIWLISDIAPSTQNPTVTFEARLTFVDL